MMATEGVVESETTTLGDLDWEYVPCCDVAQLAREVDKWAGPFCQDDPAEWRAVRGCCGARNLLCTPCREVYEHHRSIGATFTCALCQNQHSGYAYFEAL